MCLPWQGIASQRAPKPQPRLRCSANQNSVCVGGGHARRNAQHACMKRTARALCRTSSQDGYCAEMDHHVRHSSTSATSLASAVSPARRLHPSEFKDCNQPICLMSRHTTGVECWDLSAHLCFTEQSSVEEYIRAAEGTTGILSLCRWASTLSCPEFWVTVHHLNVCAASPRTDMRDSELFWTTREC